MPSYGCVICGDEANEGFMCKPCGKAFDKFVDSKENVGDTMSVIMWAARRAIWCYQRSKDSRAHKGEGRG